jgi:hypothetical protein
MYGKGPFRAGFPVVAALKALASATNSLLKPNEWPPIVKHEILKEPFNMTKIGFTGLLASLLLAGTVSTQAAPLAAGSWNVSIGTAEAPCTVTLAQDQSGEAGTASAASECTGAATQIARWSTVASKLMLKSANGSTLAVLHPDGTNFVGTQCADSRKVVLSPVNSSVAQRQ